MKTSEMDNNKSETSQWYVMRVSYGRAEKANDMLMSKGIETFLPLHTIYKVINGKRTKRRVPLLPNFLFVHTTLQIIETLLKSVPTLSFIKFYFNHFETNDNGKNPPLVVPKKEMDNFIKLTDIDDEHIRVVDESQLRYCKGDIVRVTDGAFCGIVGTVAKITGQQRVVVEIPGLCNIATAYIPKAFLEVISK